MFSRMRTLSYRDIEVGTVMPTHSDQPWVWGTLVRTLGQVDTAGDCGELLAYIAYSLKADQIMQEQGDEAWEAFVVTNDDRFEPFLIGNAWRLVSSDGDVWIASVVNFYSDGTIGWR